MCENDETQAHFLSELAELRQRVAELEASEAERRRAEVALRASEQAFRALLNATTDAVFLVDVSGRVLAVNEQFARRYDRPTQELVGTQMDESSPLHLAQSRREHLNRVVQSRQLVRFEDERQGRWLENSFYPIMDDTGQVVKIAVYSRDVTTRKQAEEALRRYAQRLEELHEIDRAILAAYSPETIAVAALRHIRLLLACQRASVVTFDYASQIATLLAVDVNGETRLGHGHVMPLDDFGITPDLRLGQPHIVNDIAALAERPATDEQLLAEGLRSYVSVPLMIQAELIGSLNVASSTPGAFTPDHLEIIREAATSLAIAIQQAQLREQIQGYADELEQRVTERTAQLETAYKELETFSYSVSHDLRAPLRAMDGFSRILLAEYATQLAPEAQRYLRLVGDNARQMGHLIDDLLAFSRLSRQSLNRQPIAPDALVRQALDSLSVEREGRQVEIAIGDLAPCEADPVLLKQVWVNLLSNALKFTRQRKEARIEVGCKLCEGSEPSQGCIYFVKDNGVGFDMRFADRIFGVFQRLHSAEEYEGTGVGLAIAQRIVRHHGGRMWVEAAVGRGATFYFTLGG